MTNILQHCHRDILCQLINRVHFAEWNYGKQCTCMILWMSRSLKKSKGPLHVCRMLKCRRLGSKLIIFYFICTLFSKSLILTVRRTFVTYEPSSNGVTHRSPALSHARNKEKKTYFFISLRRLKIHHLSFFFFITHKTISACKTIVQYKPRIQGSS